MVEHLKKTALVLGFFAFSMTVFSQCEIKYRVFRDGMMQYYMEPVNFYWTNTKSLKGCIVTDKENYFIELHPVPVPEKKEGKKLKKDLNLKMSDGITYDIKHYDTRYVEDDSVMEMLFLIDKEDIDRLLNLEVVEAKIDMMGTEGIRTYVFKLHKTALKEQLACFLKKEEKEDKK